MKTYLFILIFGLNFLSPLAAQNIELTDYYKQQLEKKEMSLSERESLLDSLILKNDMEIDALMLADIYYNFAKEKCKTGFKKEAISYAEKVFNIADKTGDFYQEVFAGNHLNTVRFLLEDNQFYKAIRVGESYLERYKEQNKKLVKLYRRMGNAYMEIGDFQQAIDFYDKSLYMLKSFKNDTELSRVLISKLMLYISLHDSQYYGEIEELKNQLEILDLSDFEISAKNKKAIGLNLGTYYSDQEKYQDAIKEYKKVLALSETEEGKDTINIAKSLINIGSSYEDIEEIEASKKYLTEAQSYLKEGDELNSSISSNFADIYQQENNHPKALEYYQKAIFQALNLTEIEYSKLPDFETLRFSSNKIEVLEYLIDKANGWVAYYDAESNAQYLKNALETFILADQLMDVIYFESREDLSKLFWRKRGAAFYPKAVEVCYRLQQPEKAFSFMDKNKAMLLLENMTDAKAKRLSKLPRKMLDREQSLIKNIKTLQSEIQANVNLKSKELDELKDKMFIYKKEYISFIDSLENQYPKYYNYKKNIRVVKLREVQAQLQEDEIILQYILGKEKGFVALITSEKIQLKELPKTEKLVADVTIYKEAISKPFITSDDKEKYKKIAKQLYKELIPFNEKEPVFSGKKVIVISDGALQYIPFEALLNAEEKYFIDICETHYHYSLSSAYQIKRNQIDQKNTKNFIAIAPTKFQNDMYAALTTSDAELAKLSTIFGANYFQYKKATKERFSNAYGNFKIVHLSTHGGIDNAIPWLAFYDQKITLDELYFKKSQSELVVLSACKTSDGELKKGEGVMSLARGFFNAGAKSVVSSLWDINEQASNEIIQEFYKNITSGDSKSLAMQKAKLAYIQKHKNTSEASPYYWSALTVTGDISPIKIEKNYNFYYYLIGILLALYGAFLLFKKRKKASVY